MWTDLRADASVYTALRWPGGAGALRSALNWVRSPGLLILVVHRMSYAYRARRQRYGWTLGTIALGMLCALGTRLLVMIAKSEVAATTVIGAGVYLSDRGYLILGAKCIGNGTLIHERVTIGARAGEEALPAIGENVWIGPDCVIFGDSALGDGATVLPGSVLSMNVPARAVVAGNPATIVLRNFDNRPLRQTLANNIDRKSLAPQ